MPKKPTKPFVKITEEDLDLAEEFFENNKHFNEWLCAVVAYYRGKNYTIKTKIVQKYFNTYKKTMNYIIEAKQTGKKGGEQRVENQQLNNKTLQGSVQGGVQESLQPNNKEVISNNKKDNTISLSDKYPRDGELHPEMKYYRDNDKYIRFTEKFYERLKEENKARPNENITKTKVTEIKRLETVDGYEWDKICNVAKYYLDHIHDSYAPQAYGAKSFREKYLKIRDFCNRHATT
jgi:hypothetical protein